MLQDIRLLDLLELCGSTVQTGQLMNLSQPTVSRRYRSLAADFGLARKRRTGDGCAYGTSACIQMLRLGCRVHRLAAGVARLGSDMLHHPLLAGTPWLLPTPPRFRAAANWLEMVRQGVLDGALISGLELEGTNGLDRRELELVPLGELPLALAFPPLTSALEGDDPEVLLPDENLAPGLWRTLRSLGLTLRSGGNSLQTPTDWIRRIRGSSLAFVVSDRESESWATLRRRPLPAQPGSSVWLALPADWQEHPVLHHTARELSRNGGLPPRG
jgi:DNA-binding transcriptional LysR family regulator